MLYIITSVDKLNYDVEVCKITHDISEAESFLQEKLDGVENSQKKKVKCSICPVYDMMLSEEEAVENAKDFCNEFDFNEEDFGCNNEDYGVEATKLYRLHVISE